MTKSGIIIPDEAKERPIDGLVRAVWKMSDEDRVSKRSPAVGVGDQVLFQKYAGTVIVLEDVKYHVIREEELHGVVRG